MCLLLCTGSRRSGSHLFVCLFGLFVIPMQEHAKQATSLANIASPLQPPAKWNQLSASLLRGLETERWGVRACVVR